MKKFMFSALACVAFAFSGFASNEVVQGEEFVSDLNLEAEMGVFNIKLEEFAPCQVEFWIFSPKGEFIEYVHELTDTPKLSDCYSFGAGLIRKYELAYPNAIISDVLILF